MNETSRQQELVDTLKAFNNSVVSIRLYPAGAPQITNAVERGYKLITQHLRHKGMFTLGLQEAEAELCGEMVPAETLQSISNLIVYRQLDLLELPQLVIRPGIDRTSFAKLLEIFSAKVDQVKAEGGGRAFAARLGLDQFFSEEGQVENARQAALLKTDEQVPEMPRVSEAFIGVLLGRRDDIDLLARVEQVMTSVDEGSMLLAAAVKEVLRQMVKKNSLTANPALRDVFAAAGEMVADEKYQEFGAATVQHLVKYLDLQELTVLFCQQFADGLGGLVEAQLLRQIPYARFDAAVSELRRKSSQLRLTQTSESLQPAIIAETLTRLLATPKGRQLLGQEKAKTILQAGEKNRRAKRLQAGIKSLMQGNLEMLRSAEFCLHLPLVVSKLLEDGKDKEVHAILKVLTRNIGSTEGQDRARLTASMAGVGETLVREKRWETARLLVDPLHHWLIHSSEGDSTYEKVCFFLQAVMTDSFKRGDYQLGDAILSSMHRIRSGVLKKPVSARTMVARAQDRAVDRQLLIKSVDASLADPADEVLGRRIILQGPVASKYLVDCLVKADKTQDRLKLIDLLTYGDQELAPVLLAKLSEPMLWHGKRNLLKLLADCGGEEHIDVAYSYLGHEDLRVQREAFVCLYKISGTRRKSTLLRALHDSGENVKLQIVRALAIFADGQVVKGLAQVLEEHQYYSDEFRDTLLAETCHSLARCKPQEAEKVLANFLDGRNSRQARKIGEAVWLGAEDGLARLRERQQDEKTRQAQASKQRKNLLSKVSSARIAKQQKNITGLEEERKIRELIAGGDVTARVKAQLLDLIAKVARQGRFGQAEQLRNWLIEVDDTALKEILRAAEIIEEEKGVAVGSDGSHIWAGLFDVLTGEEFAALYNSLAFKRYAAEESIVRRGGSQGSLFFINSGEVKLFYREGGSEILVKVLNSGEVFGAETFFEVSVSTLSAAALSSTEIGQLSVEKLEKLRKDFPGLESKLQSFSSVFNDVKDFFSSSGRDRRRDERYALICPVSTVLLNADGQPCGIHNEGELIDISLGGVSFFLRMPREENSRLLLGREIGMTLRHGTDGELIMPNGVVKAVRPRHVKEYGYSVHVEFREQLDPQVLQGILDQRR